MTIGLYLLEVVITNKSMAFASLVLKVNSYLFTIVRKDFFKKLVKI